MKRFTDADLDMICSLIETIASDKWDEEEIPFDDADICSFDGDCSECPYEKQCVEELDDCSGDCEHCDLFMDDDDDESELNMWGIPDIDRVVFSGPATIVFWTDGTKTVVKCMDGEKFERYAGFMAACMKKMFGSTSRAKATMRYFTVEQPEPEKKKKNEQTGKQTDMSRYAADKNIYYTDMESVIKEAVNEALEK